MSWSVFEELLPDESAFLTDHNPSRAVNRKSNMRDSAPQNSQV